MYAVGIINLGGYYGDVMPAGNNGLQKLRNKSPRGWRSETSTMSKVVDKVYVVNDFTQKMCEMDGNDLSSYVIKHGTLIWEFGREVR